MTYNPEKKDWAGRSYRKGGERVRVLRDKAKAKEAKAEAKAS